MSAPVASGLTYADLAATPDDHLRRELIDGELYVTPAPNLRHQRVVARITAALLAHAEAQGGEVWPAPTDVVFAADTVVEPDVVFVEARREHLLGDDRFVDIVPDLVVEVSSPGTRRLDLIAKRDLYERQRVDEYWFVDLEADRIDVHRLDTAGRYGRPTRLAAGDTLTCRSAPGFAFEVGRALHGPQAAGISDPPPEARPGR